MGNQSGRIALYNCIGYFSFYFGGQNRFHFLRLHQTAQQIQAFGKLNVLNKINPLVFTSGTVLIQHTVKQCTNRRCVFHRAVKHPVHIQAAGLRNFIAGSGNELIGDFINGGKLLLINHLQRVLGNRIQRRLVLLINNTALHDFFRFVKIRFFFNIADHLIVIFHLQRKLKIGIFMNQTNQYNEADYRRNIVKNGAKDLANKPQAFTPYPAFFFANRFWPQFFRQRKAFFLALPKALHLTVRTHGVIHGKTKFTTDKGQAFFHFQLKPQSGAHSKTKQTLLITSEITNQLDAGIITKPIAF